MKKLPMHRLVQLMNAIAGQQTLYLPAERAGQVNWARYGEGTKVCLDALNTSLPAKELFFPQCENLVDFAVDGQKIEIRTRELECENFVALGVRACDVKGMEILDRVFLAEPADPFYKARREHGTIVSLSCASPDKTCFCKALGIDAAEPAGDVTCWITADFLYWRANTEKGENLTQALSDLLEDGGEAAVQREMVRVREVVEGLPYTRLQLPDFGEEELKKHFSAPIWAKLSEACLSCGGCTFACPTCQCYDIRDFDTGHGIQRYRCWDSCLYSDFTMMAHGTPRPTRAERFRQRFMHKLVYFPMNNQGVYGCVGCGRCVRKCPVSMHIIKVIKAMGREEHV